jgi:hypothetical protein
MVSFQLQPRRLIVIAGFAAAIFAGQAFAVSANPTTDSITACGAGKVVDQYTRMCGTGAVPASAVPAPTPIGAVPAPPPVGPPSEGALTACSLSPDQPMGPPGEMDLTQCTGGAIG